MRNRWYAPELGRFLSRDPIGLEGGTNQNVFVLGRPNELRDPLGLKINLSNIALINVIKSSATGLAVWNAASDASVRLKRDINVELISEAGIWVDRQGPMSGSPTDVAANLKQYSPLTRLPTETGPNMGPLWGFTPVPLSSSTPAKSLIYTQTDALFGLLPNVIDMTFPIPTYRTVLQTQRDFVQKGDYLSSLAGTVVHELVHVLHDVFSITNVFGAGGEQGPSDTQLKVLQELKCVR
jgi:hypothetical protein